MEKIQNHQRILLVATPADKPYLLHLKSCVGTASVAIIVETPSTFAELKAICKLKQATAVISTSQALLQRCVDMSMTQVKKPSIDNYAGSLFMIPGSDIECLFINPLEQLITVSYGKFITSRYVSKLIAKEKWIKSTEFNWELFSEEKADALLSLYSRAEVIAIDIETFQEPPSIRCVGYTALFYSGNSGWTSHSLVIPCDSAYNLAYIRKFNLLPIDKVLQNGKYDLSYLQAYNAAPSHYMWDTAEFFHSWYSELPKDLASLNAFFVRESMYWKDLSSTNDLHQYYLYNAKDTWATANVLLAWMAEAPDWARNNYANTFPLQFPCHLSEMTGIARDLNELEVAAAEQTQIIETMSASLDKMLGVTGFNTNSPIQMRQLLHILGCGDLPSAGEKDLTKAAFRHPLNSRILNQVIRIRKARKLISTYLTEGKEFDGHLHQYRETKRPRILYSLNPHGTDTGRLASKEHHFWCGLQIQNIPRGTAVKRTLIADDGFRIAECDLEQAESRDTAHIAGDENLIAAVSGERDFHSVNASAFFGIPYDLIYDDVKKKTLNKPLRDLAKRVNHGANYLMGEGVLIDTMGEEKVIEAKKLLKLPVIFTLKQVAAHLLGQFHKTYLALKGKFYPGIIHEVITTGKLSSKAIHHVDYQASPQGLVRFCFGKPDKNKSDLNAYVAHAPQSLNAMTLNRAYMKVFYEIALNPDYSNNFKLMAQIHDSILFQFRVGHDYLIDMVRSAMEIPVTVTGYDGKTRTFTVPAAAKAGGDDCGAERWSLTE